MSKSEIARRLHQMVDERLPGNKPWPMGQESAKDAHATLLELGLIEYVSATDYRDTTLGKEGVVTSDKHDYRNPRRGRRLPRPGPEALIGRGFNHATTAHNVRGKNRDD